MKVIEHLQRARETLLSYEIIPPRRGGNIEDIFALVEQLLPFDPPFIDVTSHAAQVEYEELPDGTWRRRVIRKRPGTIGLCAAIQNRYNIDTVPHLLCRGFTREETEDALIELHYLGIHNVMALRGDDPGFRKTITDGRSCNEYAVDLVRQIVNMNRGRYLEPDLLDAAPTDFCIGVAGYPEKHFEAPNMERDLRHLKAKVDAGAHYIVTQMFFDNRKYFDFVARCRALGIEVPIIPGIKVLSKKTQLQSIPSRFHVEIPEELAAEIEAAPPEHVLDVGVEWAIRQCVELMEQRVPCIHFYIMQDASAVIRVIEGLRKLA
jgi:methylenetetrahydrofolate reductase (NADPH)|nr:MAG: methylenetetrahydrofolate reductase [Bacteroidota bacterium]